MEFKAGALQFNVRLGNTRANLASAVAGLRRMGDGGVRLAVLPEMWSCGFHHGMYREHAERTPEILSQVSEIASEYGMVIAGSMPEEAEGKIYNTQYLVESDGSLASRYRKIHLFGFAGEGNYFSAGNQAVVFDSSLGPLGLMTCYDVRFPELGRTLVNRGAKIVLVSAQWPVPRIRTWDILVAARAIENQCYLIAANRNGRDMMHHYPGHSFILAPDGEVLATAGDEDACLMAEIDLSRVDTVRRSMRCLDERVPSAYNV